MIADSFARIFYRNSIDIGLAIVECPQASAEIQDGDEIEADLDRGIIVDKTTGKKYEAAPFPPFIQEIIQFGGISEYVRQKMLKED